MIISGDIKKVYTSATCWMSLSYTPNDSLTRIMNDRDLISLKLALPPNV